MKTLRFCFLLFGLLFCTNGNMKAQLQQVAPQVSMKKISGTVIGTNDFSITVESNIPVILAIRLDDADLIPVVNEHANLQSDSAKTEHTFFVNLPIGEQTYLTCGYMDGSTYKASDGGCIIGTDLDP